MTPTADHDVGTRIWCEGWYRGAIPLAGFIRSCRRHRIAHSYCGNDLAGAYALGRALLARP
jgi:hypothetical protein